MGFNSVFKGLVSASALRYSVVDELSVFRTAFCSLLQSGIELSRKSGESGAKETSDVEYE
jgi:hypothetical protein